MLTRWRDLAGWRAYNWVRLLARDLWANAIIIGFALKVIAWVLDNI